jgi:F-box protein 6
VEHKFKDYPAGMRYLKLRCWGMDNQFWRGHYGVKLANCSVKAMVEKNAE